MKIKNHSGLIFLNGFMAAGLLMAGFMPTASAAESSWVKRCTDTEGKVCEMVQRLMDQQSGARVLEMAVAMPPEGDDARAVLIAPLGVELTQGFSLTIDDKDTVSFKPRYCLTDGCYAFLVLPPDIIKLMGQGKMMTLSFYTYDGQPARLPVSLDGFSETLQSLKK
ncbi:MAG: invasion associated locus B family protein [Micavibrio sp.]